MGPVLGTPELFQLLHIVTPRLSMVQTTSLLNTNMVICPPAFLSSYPELCNAVSRSQVTIHQYHFLPPMVTLRWFRFWSNLSPPAMYRLYCSSWTRYWWGGPALDPVLADGAGVLAVPLNQNVNQLLGGKKSMSPKCDRQTRWKKSNFCLQKTHTNRNSNGIQSPIIYKIRCN